jgi:phosphatidylserine/phosphatidylglycerophosphate/cardiolipin synthase-like enzyme
MASECLPLPDADYFWYLAARIPRAKRRVYLYMFIADARAGRDPLLMVRVLIRQLARAHRRKLDVRVILAQTTTADIAIANDTTLAFCTAHGLRCRETTSRMRPPHAKYLIIDNEVIVGSHNWESGAFRNFVEDSVAIRDQKITTRLLEHFGTQWRSSEPVATPTDPELSAVRMSFSLGTEPRIAKPAQKKMNWLPVQSIRLLPNSRYFSSVTTSIDRAAQSLDLVMFYVSAPKKSKSQSRSRALVDRLVAAAGRGVGVRVVLDKDRVTDIYGSRVINKGAYESLKAAGVDVAFDSVRRVTHSKLLIVDGRTVFIGSHNWTDSSLRRLEEISVAIRSDALATFYRHRTSAVRSHRRPRAAAPA